MSAPTTWNWRFYASDGITTLFQVSGSDPLVHKNPSITFDSEGEYFARLVATNVHNVGSGEDTPSDTGLVAFTVTEPAAFAHKATAVNTVAGGTTSTTNSIPSIAVGDLIVVSALGISSPGGVASVSDGLAGNTYAPVAATQLIPGGGWGKNRTFWCVAVTGGANVPLVVTYADATAVGSQGSIVVNQYVHTGTVTLVGHAEASGAGVGGPVDPGTVVASVGDLLVLGSGLWGSTVPTLPAVPSGEPIWTARFQSYVADRLNVAAGSQTYRPTYAGVQNWIAQLVVFTTAAIPVDNPPTGAITSHANPASLEAASIVLGGTAADDIGVASVSWRNATTAVVGSASGTTAWTTTAIPLQVGLNNLEVLITDSTDQVTVKTIAITRTVPVPATPFPPRFMRGFGGVRGVAANDFILTPLTAHAAQRSILFWYRRDGTGARCLFTKSSNAIQPLTESLVAPGDSLLHLLRKYSGGTGEWTCPEPVAGARHCLVIKIDTGAPTALPVLKIDNVSQTLTVVRQPAGGETPASNAAGYMLGNWPGQNGSVLGDLAKWTVYNRLTTNQEDADFYEGDNPLTMGVAPVAYHKLDGTAANEPDSVTTTISALTGTVVQDYEPVTPPDLTVTLAITAGDPAQGIPWQLTATVVGTPVNRVEFNVDTVLTETRLTAPYRLFDGAVGLLGAGLHTIEARAYPDAGATPDDTDSRDITEPSIASGAWLANCEFGKRVQGAVTYEVDIDGTPEVTIPQPAAGKPRGVINVTGADVTFVVGVTPIFAGPTPGARTVSRVRFRDPRAVPPEGFKEIARPYDGTTWTPQYRVNRDAFALSYNFALDGDTPVNVLQPSAGPPIYIASFTGADVTKVVTVWAVYAGAVEGPKTAFTLRYVAPATEQAPGFQILSRVFTP